MKIESGSVKLGSERKYSSRTSFQYGVSVSSGYFNSLRGYLVGTADSLKGHSENYNGLAKKRGSKQYGSSASGQGSSSTVKTGGAQEVKGGKQVKSMAQIRLEFLARLLGRLEEIKERIGNRTGNSGTAFGGVSYGGQTVESTVNGWTYTSYSSSTFTEEETTAFTSKGTVKTQDGREISFDVSIEMSRKYSEKYESVMVQTIALTDPLVINYDADAAQVSDMKFFFDLDCDGEEEKVSFLKRGSGFLAFDKNGDGIVNDGGELFGTKSGDGFADLAAYDEDGNGWIDESDSIFKELKIWIHDEYGQNILVPIKDAGVGAICLSNRNTEFSLNSPEDNHTNAVIRRSGIFLMENGNAGTIQHVDFSA